MKTVHRRTERTRASAPRLTGLVIVVAVVAATGIVWWLSPAGPLGLVPAGPPRLETDRQSIDFGDVPFGRWVTAAFTVRNSGAGPLEIAGVPRVRAVEGC